jgi:hypothetical protein
MKLASGVAPVPKMLSEQLHIGLGTDGAASNNDLNMWEEMDTVAKLHKVFTGDPKVISAQEAFELATIRGAQALHLDKEIGSLKPESARTCWSSIATHSTKSRSTTSTPISSTPPKPPTSRASSSTAASSCATALLTSTKPPSNRRPRLPRQNHQSLGTTTRTVSV